MKRLLEAWPLLAWMTLAVVVAVLLIGCETTTQAAQPQRFVTLHQQPDPSIRVIQDSWTGACFVQVSPGSHGSGLAEAPKEVCEVKNP